MKGKTQFTVQDFEDKSRELSTIMYALTEERFHAAYKRKSPVGRTMQESVLSAQAAMSTFLFIARLSGLP